MDESDLTSLPVPFTRYIRPTLLYLRLISISTRLQATLTNSTVVQLLLKTVVPFSILAYMILNRLFR